MLEVCVRTYPWYKEDEPEGSIKYIRECGIEALDYNFDTWLPGKAIRDGEKAEFFDQSVEELLDYYKLLKEALERYGVKLSQTHAPFPLHVEDNEEMNDYLLMVVEKCCAVCQYLGCPAVVVHPFTYPEKQREEEINLQMYRKMIPFGKKYGVTLCIENLLINYKGHMLESVCSDVSEMCRYIDTLNAEAGEDLFGCCFDVGHANLLGRNIRSYINGLGKRLTILHIHDNNGRTDGHMIPYTQDAPGGVDWEGFLAGLRDIHYRGPISFETFRGTRAFPQKLWTESLRLVGSIGRYFRSRLGEGDDNHA